MTTKNHWVAYVITERGERSYWSRIGVAFENRDGSLNVKLDSLPVGGQMQLRRATDDDERGGG